MAASGPNSGGNGHRHKLLDLAPLELECMSCLWPLGEATVREIREALAESRPRAYTTIMTIMDRLAQKGIVARRRAGRAWVYTPNISAEEARARAVAQVIEHFFGGSPEALLEHIAGGAAAASVPALPPRPERLRRERRAAAPANPEFTPPAKLDDTLL